MLKVGLFFLFVDVLITSLLFFFFSGSQDPQTLDPDMEELEAAQEEMLGRKINKLNFKVSSTRRFSFLMSFYYIFLLLR